METPLEQYKKVRKDMEVELTAQTVYIPIDENVLDLSPPLVTHKYSEELRQFHQLHPRSFYRVLQLIYSGELSKWHPLLNGSRGPVSFTREELTTCNEVLSIRSALKEYSPELQSELFRLPDRLRSRLRAEILQSDISIIQDNNMQITSPDNTSLTVAQL